MNSRAGKFALCLASLMLASEPVFARAVLPGYLTDPTAMKEALEKKDGYQTPQRLKYPYVSTYYVKPTVFEGEAVKIGIFVTDFESSKIRFLDDSHSFDAFLEYRLKGADSKIVSLKNIKSGDAEFSLGALPAGEYELRVWACDDKGRESHRVIHDFRVVRKSDLLIRSDKVYVMGEGDLVKYGIRNDGGFEKIVYVGADGKSEVIKEKRSDVPGYTVTVALDPKTGKLPYRAFQKAKVVYDEGYDKAAVESAALSTVEGIQKLLDDKAAEGFRKVVMLPGIYRVSHKKSISIPDGVTLDLNRAVIKQNGFTGAYSVLVKFESVTDSHLVGGTLEGDYWSHDYLRSPKNSEWPAGFQIGGDCWYCSVENVNVVDITGYGGQNGVAEDSKGWLTFFYESLPKFSPGGIDRKTGLVDASDAFMFTTDFKDLGKITGKYGRKRLQISKMLGYQGIATRSWQMTVAWFDAQKKFISAETAWQYREMWIPEGAAFLRVSVEAESVEAANKSGLMAMACRLPVNCSVRNCRFENCRCVGYAASAMKNMLFEGNYFTRSGESAARCAFDAEDGWDQMQDVYFTRNVFRDNPVNNSILTCAGHNFILENNDGDIYFWGRTHSPCVRNSTVGKGTYWCDSRLRSGYGRFNGNTYTVGVQLGLNEMKARPDSWDHVLSGDSFDGKNQSFSIETGPAGRVVNCTFRNMPVSIANAYACTFDNCTDASTYKPFPDGRWFEVTVKNSKFSRFYRTHDWERCRFENTKLERFNGGKVTAKKCEFLNSSIFGLDSTDMKMADCSFDGATVCGNYWEKPARLSFTDCRIATGKDVAFVKLGAYTVGKISFDGCAVSGSQSLVDVFDMRSLSVPANTDPSRNPDRQAGSIELQDMKWSSAAKTVIARAKGGSPQSKKIEVLDKGNVWPEGVAAIGDLPPSWQLK